MTCLGQVEPADPFTVCDQQVREAPRDLASYRCYWQVARRLNRAYEAVRRLEALLAKSPEEPRILLYLGAIEADQDAPRTNALLLHSARGFAAEGEAIGEVYARLTVAFRLETTGDFAAAADQLERAVAAAERSGDPELQARATYGQGLLYYQLGRYSQSLAETLRVRDLIFPTGPIDLQQNTLNLLGNLFWSLGRLEEAVTQFQGAANVAAQMQDSYLEVSERFNRLFLEREIRQRRGQATWELRNEVMDLLKRSQQAGNHRVRIASLLLLARLEAGDGASALLEEARAAARRLQLDRLEEEAAWLSAFHNLPSDERHLQSTIRSLRQLAHRAKSRGDLVFYSEGLIHAARLAWANGRADLGWDLSRRAIESMERLRALQRISGIRAFAFSRYAGFYREFAGWLLGSSQPLATETASAQLAVDVLERARARSLHDELSGPASPSETPELHSILSRIAEIQRTLQQGPHPPSERRRLLQRLDRLEADEYRQREALPGTSAVGPAIPQVDLAEIRSLLAPDEAILSFQLAPPPLESKNWGGAGRLHEPGSWVMLITSTAVDPIRLDENFNIESWSHLLRGLVLRGDGSEVTAARQFTRVLLMPALDRLAPGIQRLILIPEPEMELLPFEALRFPSDTPVIDRYRIERCPSLATFALLRRRPPAVFSRGVLALADPALPVAAHDTASARGGSTSPGTGLARLPYARGEGRHIQQTLRRGSTLYSDGQASESRLKSLDLSRYAILHLATHTFVDPSAPGRSALLLAADADQDGLLQVRDLEGLDLERKVVVLATCRSAVGRVVGGEGVASLARGFLQAGAQAVVSTLWPLRDDYASIFFEKFYWHLAKGRSLSSALYQTRQELIREGAPARLWSGVILLGDGSAVPLAASGTLLPLNLAWPTLLIGVPVFLVFRRRRSL